MGDETTIVTTEEWSSPAAAALQLGIPGKPGEMTGSLTVEKHGDGVVQTVNLAITVSIPFVGGKAELELSANTYSFGGEYGHADFSGTIVLKGSK